MDNPNGSDNIPILITINYSRNIHPPILNQSANSSFSKSFSFNLNKADWIAFSQFVQNSISYIQDTTSPTICYSTFIDIINQASISSIPVKKTYSNTFPPSSPWWNSSCTKAVKNRSSLFKLFRRSGSMADFIAYSESCATTAQTLKKEKRRAWKNFCTNLNPSATIH
jgi:hypothetical protein